jgi:ABC-type multidrug transport system ATPase subunit
MFIEAEGLGRRFGSKQALRDLTFTCQSGEIVVLIGNNGSGKTTLLQIIAGLLASTSGTVRLKGELVNRRDEAFRRSLGFLPDFPPFFPEHTVIQHLAMVCRLHEVNTSDLEARALTLMEEIGILELGELRLATLSRGQVYKTAFVSLLLVRPSLWLLDEPMASGMDPRGLTFLRKHLREQADGGATILYSTQIADVAERFSDRVFLLEKGLLEIQESVSSLLARTGAATLDEALQRPGSL